MLAINFGLTALRFLWVWISLYVSYRIAARKGDTERSPPGFRLVAAMSVAGSVHRVDAHRLVPQLLEAARAVSETLARLV